MSFKDSKLVTILISGFPLYLAILGTPVIYGMLQTSVFTRSRVGFNWGMYLFVILVSLILSYDLAKHNLKEEEKEDENIVCN